MAIVTSWGFTNTTDSSLNLVPTALDWDNYAVTTDDPDRCVLKNTTSPIDQVETISFLSQELGTINQDEKNYNPPKVTNARAVTIKVEDKKRVTSTTDDFAVVDLPASCNITWRFSKNSNLTDQDLLEMLKRAVGALQNRLQTGWTFNSLMMKQLNPKK